MVNGTTTKFVYAYDYFDGTDNIKEAERDSHGMHVTGIATGNPDKEAGNGEKIYGVAPEAQVMFMRVFSDRQKTTGSALYVKAIDDAVALGADAINMSLDPLLVLWSMQVQISLMRLNELVLRVYLS